MIRGSPWSRRALSSNRGRRKSRVVAGHELALATPSSYNKYCPDCTVPWRRARAAGLSYVCAGLRGGSAGLLGAPLGAFGDAGYILSAAGLIPSLWRPSAVWHCCAAAPAEGAALAANDEEWLLQQIGVSQSSAGGEKWPRGRRDGEANPI